ncbi:amidohydrolase family protein [Fodinicurvata sp. EGI_FJ10296]|uniref:amidohydrolase family protein n=1 Tax=Fodinicurvata sp. EGI_FJ10296 TaxID=3231908 RepID=UPI0034561963
MSSTGKTLIIKGGRVYDHDGDVHMPPKADILIENGIIKAIGPDLADRLAAGQSVEGISGAAVSETIDANGQLVLPGFVNAHYHSHDVLLKGSYETIPLEFWVLNALPPSYPKRSPEELRARTLLGVLECLKSGMTTVQDMVTVFPFDPADIDVIQDAYDEIGIRSVLALQVADVPGLKSIPFWEDIIPEEMRANLTGAVEPFGPDVDLFTMMEDTIKAKRGAKSRVHWALGPSSPERCTESFMERLADLSARENLPIYSHLYESKAMTLIARQEFKADGGSLIRYMQRTGVLGPRLSLAHSVWLLPDEIDMLAEAGANVVLNPVGNLKTRSGIAPITDLVAKGVNVALGSDNCSCSDVQNMFQAMKLYCSLAGVLDPMPGRPFAADALKAATVNGARTAGLQDRIGALKPGMAADLSILDLSDVSYVPLNSVARQTVFTETARSVRTVMVDGEVILRDGRSTRIDEQALYAEVEGLMDVVRRDRDAVEARTRMMEPYLLKAHKMIWDDDVGTNRYVAGPSF